MRGRGSPLRAAIGSAAAIPRFARDPSTAVPAVPLPICDGEDPGIQISTSSSLERCSCGPLAGKCSARASPHRRIASMKP